MPAVANDLDGKWVRESRPTELWCTIVGHDLYWHETGDCMRVWRQRGVIYVGNLRGELNRDGSIIRFEDGDVWQRPHAPTAALGGAYGAKVGSAAHRDCSTAIEDEFETDWTNLPGTSWEGSPGTSWASSGGRDSCSGSAWSQQQQQQQQWSQPATQPRQRRHQHPEAQDPSSSGWGQQWEAWPKKVALADWPLEGEASDWTTDYLRLKTNDELHV